MINVAQNRTAFSCHRPIAGDKRAEDPAKVKSNGIVSSFSSAAAGFRLEVSWNVAGDAQTAGPGSSITNGMPVLWADYAASQTILSGVRKVAQYRFS